MGRLQIVISDETEQKLRRAAAKFGYKKGDISRAVEEAIIEWLKSR